MRNINSLLKEMKERNVQQRDNIDEFSRNHMATATDIYRAEYYSELVKKETDYLSSHLQDYAKTSKKDRKEYKRAKENVMLQANILKLTQKALNDQLDALTLKTDIQILISGKMTDQKLYTDYLLEKAEKIINNAHDATYQKV